MNPPAALQPALTFVVTPPSPLPASIAPTTTTISLPLPPAPALLQAAVQPFTSDRGMRDKKRAIDKFVTLNVQQISATLEQVGLVDGCRAAGGRQCSGGVCWCLQEAVLCCH